MAREVAPGLELGFWHEMADYVDDAEGVWLNDWTTHRGQDDVRAGVARAPAGRDCQRELPILRHALRVPSR